MAKKIKCEDCEWFFHKGTPVWCARYPEWREISLPHYCGEYKSKPKPKSTAAKDTRRSALIEHYCDVFKDVFTNRALIQGPDAQAAVTLLKSYSLDEAKEWIDKFLDLDYTPSWNRENRAFSLRNAPAAIQKMSAYDG